MEPTPGATLAPILGAVFPVFALIACGYLAGRLRLVNQASSEALNQFVYYFALPAMLFVAVYRGSLEEILSGWFMLGVVAATLGTAAGGFAVSRLFQNGDGAQSTLRALNASFANTGYLGIPLTVVTIAGLPVMLALLGLGVLLLTRKKALG